jgi:hypothetical protein
MFLSTGNFDGGLGAWRPVNYASAVTATVVNDPASAKQGSSFMRFQTSTAGGSVAHDVTIPRFVTSVYVPPGQSASVQYGVAAFALSFSVWLRSAPGQSTNLSGTVALWDLDNNVATDTRFSIGNQWVQVTAGMDGPAPNVRAEIYLNTIGQWLDVDGAVLV